MYDRRSLLQAIDTECLSDIGSSTVVIGGHKLGKSHLLHHIQHRGQQPGTVFCRIDMDMLKSKAAKPTDHVFLDVFLTELLGQIDSALEAGRPDLEQWQRDLPLARNRADALQDLAADDPQLRTSLQRQQELVRGYEQKIAECLELEEAAASLRTLIPPGRTIEVADVSEVFGRLRRWRTRIVLLIDDYDAFVRAEALSDGLFSFLRSMNSQRRIITLVSSGAHLMDVVPGVKSADRKSLFNHFHIQRLVPFRDSEPAEFLDWLAEQEHEPVRLTDDEKEYLVALGGGCPQLLKRARLRFVSARRPTRGARAQFEKDALVDEFRPLFEQIWSTATLEEQAALRTVADGGIVPPNQFDRLEAEGCFVPREDRVSVFSTLFAEFIRRQPKPSAVPPHAAVVAPHSAVDAGAGIACKVEVPYEVFPSALLYATRDSAEMVVFHIDNRTGKKQRLELAAQMIPHSQREVLTEEFEPGPKTIALAVALTPEAKSLQSPVWTTVQYTVTQSPGANEEIICSRNQRVRLLPRDHFLFARRDPIRDTLLDFSWLIAAWVDPGHSCLDAVIEAAMKTCPHLGDGPARDDRVARERMRALFAALVNPIGIEYFDDAVVFHADDNDFMQRVKTCADMLRARRGNCLDGSVLFASLALKCGLDAGIVLVPGHALAAWRVPGAPDTGWQFLDTTALRRVPFDDGVRRAGERLRSLGVPVGKPGLEIRDPRTFAILVDVGVTTRERQIVPI
jgi:hypothetical protein